MKKLLVGVLALGALSSFANCTVKVNKDKLAMIKSTSKFAKFEDALANKEYIISTESETDTVLTLENQVRTLSLAGALQGWRTEAKIWLNESDVSTSARVSAKMPSKVNKLRRKAIRAREARSNESVSEERRTNEEMAKAEEAYSVALNEALVEKYIKAINKLNTCTFIKH